MEAGIDFIRRRRGERASYPLAPPETIGREFGAYARAPDNYTMLKFARGYLPNVLSS